MRVLYGSGYEDGRAAGTAQRVAVLRKPFTSDGLAAAVRQALHPN